MGYMVADTALRSDCSGFPATALIPHHEFPPVCVPVKESIQTCEFRFDVDMKFVCNMVCVEVAEG